MECYRRHSSISHGEIQVKDEEEAVEVAVMRNGTQTKGCLLRQPPLHSSQSGGIEAWGRMASLGLLGLPASPQRATVKVEFEILAMLMEVRITETGFTAPKIDPELYSISQN